MKEDLFEEENDTKVELGIQNNKSQPSGNESNLFGDNLIGDSSLGSLVAGTILKQTSEKTKNMLDTSKYVSYFTPFFDIEPMDVIHRLVFSIVPNSRKETNEKDLYGPMMCVLTLMAIILLGMKINGVQMIEGTIIGSSFLISTTFWIGSSLFFYALTYFFSIDLGLAEILSKVGYSLFSYCIILLSFVFHFPHFSSFIGKHLFLFIFGGLSSFTLAKYFSSKSSQKYFWIVGIIIFFFHFSFMLLFANVYSTNPNFYHHEDVPVVPVVNGNTNGDAKTVPEPSIKEVDSNKTPKKGLDLKKPPPPDPNKADVKPPNPKDIQKETKAEQKPVVASANNKDEEKTIKN